MDATESLNQYLTSVARERQDGTRDQPRSLTPFVTISRESGAGGHTLAQAILDAFEARRGDALFEGWKIFDRELCELVASDRNLDVALRSLLEESSLNAVEDMVSMMMGKSPQREVHEKVAKTIRQLAVVGKAIIVGRGAECVTRDLPVGIHFRLVAPFPVRVERESQRLGSEADDVEKWVREKDRNRASFVERVYRRKIDDPLLYDTIWNTDRVPFEIVVQSVENWVERLRPS